MYKRGGEKKKIRPCDLNRVSHGTSSYICVCINAVASVVLHLHLRRRFCNTISKNKHKFYV